MADAALPHSLPVCGSHSARHRRYGIMGQHIAIERIQSGILDFGLNPFPQIIQNDDPRGHVQPAKSLLMQLCPHLCT